MYLLAFYVPEINCDEVKAALFAAGAGRIGAYDCCAWQTKGEGQFRPLAGSNPTIGQHGQIEKVAEYKVEMVCKDDCINAVIQALKDSHPYETPAFHYMKIQGE